MDVVGTVGRKPTLKGVDARHVPLLHRKAVNHQMSQLVISRKKTRVLRKTRHLHPYQDAGRTTSVIRKSTFITTPHIVINTTTTTITTAKKYENIFVIF